MKVLLISVNTEQINMPVLPLGMACIAAASRNAGHEVKTLNLITKDDTRSILSDTVKRFSPEIIGISVRNIDDQSMEFPRFLLDSVKKIVAECQSLSDAPIVLGGAGYSIFPQSALAYLRADMGIQGEGEYSFVMLLKQLEQKGNISEIPGLWVSGTGLQREIRRSENLDEFILPLPNIHITIPSELKNEEIWMPFQTRRGCPMNCSYCSTATIEGRIMRKHSPEQAVQTLCQYAEAGIDHFFFVDNIFNFPPSYAKLLCDQILVAGLNITWRAILYPWKVNDELVEKMAKAGCREVSLGCESGSEDILKRMNKRFKPDDVRRISEMLRKHGIQRMGFLLLGGPGETKETVIKSLEFANSLDTETTKITVGIRIYPYTSLAQTAVKEGMIKPDDNLLFPKFYMVNELKEWLPDTVHTWMEDHPDWVR